MTSLGLRPQQRAEALPTERLFRLSLRQAHELDSAHRRKFAQGKHFERGQAPLGIQFFSEMRAKFAASKASQHGDVRRLLTTLCYFTVSPPASYGQTSGISEPRVARAPRRADEFRGLWI